MAGSPRVLALLRGVNVGGRNLVPMAELRAALEAEGHRDVATLLQSGNVVLAPVSGRFDREALSASLSEVIGRRFGVEVAVLIRTGAQLGALAGRNPYLAEAEADPARVHVAFLSGEPEPGAIAAQFVAPPDRMTVIGAEAFIHYPDGAGRSKLRLDLGVAATARNWRTVQRVTALLQGEAP